MIAPVCFRSLDDRGRLLLRGPDRKRFLHGMVTNDITALQPGRGCHAAMLTVKGKMLGDMVVYDWLPCARQGEPSRGERDLRMGDEDALLLEMEGGAREKIATALERHLIMDDVTVSDVSAEIGELGVYGEGAAAALRAALGGVAADLGALPPYHHIEAAGVRVAASPELGVPGFHVLGEAAALGTLRERLA